MNSLTPIFQSVSLIFALSASATGLHATLDPVGFATSFGLPIRINSATIVPRTEVQRHRRRDVALSYVALVGARQLGTGIILLIFAYRQKWEEVATVLAVIGLLVAGTDGVLLYRAGQRGHAAFHALPGAMIAALAGAALVNEATSYR